MTNDINKEDTVDVTPWMEYVTKEILTLLKIFLPVSKNGNIGLKYKNPIVGEYESHTDVDETKADAVAFTVVLEFEEPIDIPKEIELEDTK